jgi:DNA polymerase-3 subunit alpha
MIDTNEKIRIDLPSKSRQINISKELLLSLDEMELEYVLN